MYKYFSILLIAIFLNISSSKAEITRDSIGIENLNGKKLIIHKVVAHDTYYFLGRRYNVSPKEIMKYNNNKYLQIGVIIKVPTQLNFNETPANTSSISNSNSGANATGEIEHVVVAKDNLNKLAEKYGTTINEIKRLNNLKSSNLRLGQTLKIPVKPGAETAQQTAEAPVQKNESKTVTPKTITVPAARQDSSEEFLEHTVASNETIYSIATTYHLTMDQLKAKNNLTTNALHVGQKLLIRGQYPRVPQHSASDPFTLGDTTIRDPLLRGAPSKYGLNQVDEKGTAVWITDPDLDPIKMLVLHRSAPVGTIIKVTNPMTNRSTFAKVVGKFTENESTKDVIIVMTKAVADSIGAIDKRFFCNLTYSGQEIEQ